MYENTFWEESMSVTNSELTVGRELQATMREPVVSRGDDESTRVNAPQWILHSVLAALSEGRISEAVAQFSDRFTFNDHGVALEFTDKPRLTEFFEKARELFPDTTLEIVSLFESGDQAVAEWTLAATETMPYGSISYRVPISLQGSTIVRIENGRIVQWSDYYDRNSARRTNLAAFFTEWVEL
jgi:ketosteroid isomerase-like protein